MYLLSTKGTLFCRAHLNGACTANITFHLHLAVREVASVDVGTGCMCDVSGPVGAQFVWYMVFSGHEVTWCMFVCMKLLAIDQVR